MASLTRSSPAYSIATATKVADTLVHLHLQAVLKARSREARLPALPEGQLWESHCCAWAW